MAKMVKGQECSGAGVRPGRTSNSKQIVTK